MYKLNFVKLIINKNQIIFQIVVYSLKEPLIRIMIVIIILMIKNQLINKSLNFLKVIKLIQKKIDLLYYKEKLNKSRK